MPRALQAGWGKVDNAGSLELWPLRVMLRQTLQFLIPKDYRIPARLGWKLVAGRTDTQGGQWRLEGKVESSQRDGLYR